LHFIDANGETVVVVGRAPGVHHVTSEIADPAHGVVCSETVVFTVPPAMNLASS
jgi:hypothetical protein